MFVSLLFIGAALALVVLVYSRRAARDLGDARDELTTLQREIAADIGALDARFEGEDLREARSLIAEAAVVGVGDALSDLEVDGKILDLLAVAMRARTLVERCAAVQAAPMDGEAAARARPLDDIAELAA